MNSDPILLHGVRIHPRVVTRAAGLQLDLAMVSHAVLDPESTWPSHEGNGTVHLRHSVAAITDDRRGEVVAIASRESALRLRARPRESATPRRSGGTGSAFPNDVATLLRRASSAGLDVRRGGKHYVVTRPGHGGQCAVPTTPSDHRSLRNAVTQIRRVLGVDLRQVGHSS